MMTFTKLVYPVAIGFLSLGLAQGVRAQQSGLVNVDLSGIRVDIADVLDVNENQIPITVQAPIGIAANVCNVAANALAADIRNNGTAECDAENTSEALNQIVLRQ